MICRKCKATYDDDKALCPFCGHINEEKCATDTHFEKIHSPDALISNPKTLFKSVATRLGIIAVTSFIGIVCIELIFKGVTSYYEHQRETQLQQELSGEKYDANLKLINTYLDNKQYIRALTVADTLVPHDYDFATFPSVKEELFLIDRYRRFTSTLNDYILNDVAITDLYISEYTFDYYWELVNTTVLSERALKIQQELIRNADLYLKYYYRFTDQEIENLRTAEDAYDFTLEGTTEFAEIIEERMLAYDFKK